MKSTRSVRAPSLRFVGPPDDDKKFIPAAIPRTSPWNRFIPSLSMPDSSENIEDIRRLAMMNGKRMTPWTPTPSFETEVKDDIEAYAIDLSKEPAALKNTNSSEDSANIVASLYLDELARPFPVEMQVKKSRRRKGNRATRKSSAESRQQTSTSSQSPNRGVPSQFLSPTAGVVYRLVKRSGQAARVMMIDGETEERKELPKTGYDHFVCCLVNSKQIPGQAKRVICVQITTFEHTTHERWSKLRAGSSKLQVAMPIYHRRNPDSPRSNVYVEPDSKGPTKNQYIYLMSGSFDDESFVKFKDLLSVPLSLLAMLGDRLEEHGRLSYDSYRSLMNLAGRTDDHEMLYGYDAVVEQVQQEVQRLAIVEKNFKALVPARQPLVPVWGRNGTVNRLFSKETKKISTDPSTPAMSEEARFPQ